MGIICYLVLCVLINMIVLAYSYHVVEKLFIGIIYLSIVISLCPVINIIALGLIFYSLYQNKITFEKMMSDFISCRILILGKDE